MYGGGFRAEMDSVLRSFPKQDREIKATAESVGLDKYSLALGRTFNVWRSGRTGDQRLAKAMRECIASASDHKLKEFLKYILDDSIVQGRPSKRGPTLADMLGLAAKFIKVRDSHEGPYFESGLSSMHLQGSSLVPAPISEALGFGSAIEDMIDCVEAIAEKRGVLALLREEGSLQALFEVASGRSRAAGATSCENPWKRSRGLLSNLAVAQQNTIGRFLVEWPPWSDQYAADHIFWPTSGVNVRLCEVAFHGTMAALYLQGRPQDIEWLMVVDAKARCILETADFAVCKIASRCCLVLIPQTEYHGEIVSGMRDARLAKRFIEAKDAWRKFLFRILEQKLVFENVQLVLRFLGVKTIAEEEVAADGKTISSEAFAVEPTASFEAEHEVIQTVFHLDPPAVIDAIEAQQITDIQHADFAALNLGAAVLEDQDHVETIWHCTFNRYPQGLRAALQDGRALRPCREALVSRGLAWQLEDSGAVLFVHPRQFNHVIQSLPRRRLTQRDVFIAASLEHLMEQDLAHVYSVQGSFQGAWVKSRQQLVVDVESLPERAGRWTEPSVAQNLVVARSFLCASPLRRSAGSVVQSATDESNASARRNPRRAVLFELD